MNQDQLDDFGWTPDQWAALNDKAHEVVVAQARLRPLIPVGPDMPGAYVVQTPPYQHVAGAAGADESFLFETEQAAEPVVRLRCNFTVRAEQLADQPLLARLIDRAARRVAAAEDAVLMWGGAAGTLPGGPTVVMRGVPSTLRGLARGSSVGVPYEAVDGLVAAANELRGRGFYGPFNAALSTTYWNALAMDHPGSSTDGFRRARRVLGSEPDALLGLAPGDGMPPIAVVFEPSASVLDLVTVHPPRLSHVGMRDGDVVLRVEEAFFLRLFDDHGRATVETCPAEPKPCDDRSQGGERRRQDEPGPPARSRRKEADR